MEETETRRGKRGKKEEEEEMEEAKEDEGRERERRRERKGRGRERRDLGEGVELSSIDSVQSGEQMVPQIEEEAPGHVE